MADTHETIADIIAEKRRRADELEASSYRPHQFLRERIAELRQEADRLEAAHRRERDEMLDALVRIGNWCAQDLAENAFIGDASGNYEKTLHGLCEVCRPFMQKASKLKRYGGANG